MVLQQYVMQALGTSVVSCFLPGRAALSKLVFRNGGPAAREKIYELGSGGREHRVGTSDAFA